MEKNFETEINVDPSLHQLHPPPHLHSRRRRAPPLLVARGCRRRRSGRRRSRRQGGESPKFHAGDQGRSKREEGSGTTSAEVGDASADGADRAPSPRGGGGRRRPRRAPSPGGVCWSAARSTDPLLPRGSPVPEPSQRRGSLGGAGSSTTVARAAARREGRTAAVAGWRSTVHGLSAGLLQPFYLIISTTAAQVSMTLSITQAELPKNSPNLLA